MRERKSIYSHTNICRAKEAYEFLRHVGYQSPKDTINLLQDENMFGLQYLTHENLSLEYYDICALPYHISRENQVRRKSILRMVINPIVIMKKKL